MNLETSQLELFHNDKEIKGFFKEYRWLSNFHMCPVYYDGLLYPSSENAYQAAKCKNEIDRLKFTDYAPSKAKNEGRKVEMRSDWESVKLKVMYDVNYCKYIQNADLAQQLEDTKEAYLEETNYWGDTFWGKCIGIGENHLGTILMQIRKNIC